MNEQEQQDVNKEFACEKLRRIAEWLNWQDEGFNMEMNSISDIEKVFDACEKHSLEFADNLDWEDGDFDDEEYKLAVEVNQILGKRYYRV